MHSLKRIRPCIDWYSRHSLMEASMIPSMCNQIGTVQQHSRIHSLLRLFLILFVGSKLSWKPVLDPFATFLNSYRTVCMRIYQYVLVYTRLCSHENSICQYIAVCMRTYLYIPVHPYTYAHIQLCTEYVLVHTAM